MTSPQINWISTYGGRFIALPDSALPAWRGFPDDGRDPLDTSHDYGRACDTSGYANVLAVGDTQALVFGENDYGGVYLSNQFPIMFEWIYADSPDDVLLALQNLPEDLENDSAIDIAIASDHLNIFDSAAPGCEYEPQHSFRFSIAPGAYTVTSHLYEPSENIGLIVHRLIRH